MVKEKYLLQAEILAERNKNRLDTNRSPKEKETEELFYWIISRLEWSVQGCWPGQRGHTITVQAYIYNPDGGVLVEHGRVSKYLSQYVNNEEFFTVLNDIANIFNEIGKSKSKEYQFSAIFSPPGRNGICELTVHMYT